MKAGRWEPVELEVWRGKEEPPPEEGRPKGAGEGKTRAVGKPGRMRTGTGGETVGAKPKKSHEAGKGAEKGDKLVLLKKERMPNGRTKIIMREKATGRIVERIER
jgi:hypothetical protein